MCDLGQKLTIMYHLPRRPFVTNSVPLDSGWRTLAFHSLRITVYLGIYSHMSECQVDQVIICDGRHD